MPKDDGENCELPWIGSRIDQLTLVRVTSPHFVAGLILAHDICTHADPKLNWCIGWHRDNLRRYFAKKQWEAKLVRNPYEGVL